MSLGLATNGYLSDEPVGTAPLPPPAPQGIAVVDIPPPAPNGTATETNGSGG